MLWILLAWGIMGMLVLAVFGHFYLGSKHLAPEEEGLQPIYSEQCGAMFDDFLLVTFPFVRFSVYKTFLVVACGSKKYVLPFADIQEVSAKWYLLWKGIYIKHSRHDIPPIAIGSLYRSTLLSVLRNQGVAIRYA